MFTLWDQSLSNWITLQGMQSPQKGKVLWKGINYEIVRTASKTSLSDTKRLFEFQTLSNGILWGTNFPCIHPWTPSISTMQPWQLVLNTGWISSVISSSCQLSLTFRTLFAVCSPSLCDSSLEYRVQLTLTGKHLAFPPHLPFWNCVLLLQ